MNHRNSAGASMATAGPLASSRVDAAIDHSADHPSSVADGVPSPVRPRRRRRLVMAAGLLTAIVALVSVVASRSGSHVDPRPSTSVVPTDALAAPGIMEVDPTHGTPIPDIEHAVIADDGAPPRPLGEIDQLPTSDRLDFLTEVCADDRCFRDAEFVGPEVLAPWPGERPFHVRHGFVNDGDAPLDSRFDLAVYVFPMSELESEHGGSALGQTRRYVSDYVVRDESSACGPAYRHQTGTVTCELFVHEFPRGLPEGRWGMWAVWEAPCSAWIDLDFTQECDDPDEVVSFFSSGVDTGFDDPVPEPTGRITEP